MRRLTIVIGLLVCFSLSFSQPTFQKTHDLAGTREEAYAIIQINDSSSLAVGYGSVSAANKEGMATCFDAEGEIVWTKQYGGSSHERFYDVCMEDTGTFYIAGYTSSYGAGGRDGYVVKIKSNGDTIWTRTFGNAQGNEFHDIACTKDSNLIVTGKTNDGTNNQLYLVKIDTSGAIIWERSYADDTEFGYHVMDAYNGYIVTGLADRILPKGNQAYIFKANYDNGNIVWEYDFGDNLADQAYMSITTSDSGIAIVGSYQNVGVNNYDVYYIKLDSAGTFQWDAKAGDIERQDGYSIFETYDSGLVACGLYNSTTVNNNIFLSKISKDGSTIEWERSHGDATFKTGNSAFLSMDTNIVIAGIEEDFLLYYQTDRHGCFEFQPVITSDSLICDSAEIMLNLGVYATYAWSSGQDYRPVFVKEAGDYYVSVTDDNGCPGYSDTITIIDATPYFTIDMIADTLCYGNPMDLEIDTTLLQSEYDFEFLWSTSDTTHLISVDTTGDYRIIVTNTTLSCPDTAIISIFTPIPADQKLCMVSYDLSSMSQMPLWTDSLTDTIVSYNICRRYSDSISYTLVETISSDANQYIDMTYSGFEQVSYYAISTIDTCGNESRLSPYHKTLELVFDSISNGVVLQIEPYKIEGDTLLIDQYVILKGSDSTLLSPFDTIAANTFTYIDTDASAINGKMYYQLIGFTIDTCQLPDSATIFNAVYSNIARNWKLSTGITNQNEVIAGVNVFPNPFTEIINVDLTLRSASKVNINLYNTMGQMVEVLFSDRLGTSHQRLHLQPARNLDSGMYYIQIITEGQQMVKPIIRMD